MAIRCPFYEFEYDRENNVLRKVGEKRCAVSDISTKIKKGKCCRKLIGMTIDWTECGMDRKYGLKNSFLDTLTSARVYISEKDKTSIPLSKWFLYVVEGWDYSESK